MLGSLQAWYGLPELEALGEREASLRGEVAVVKLTRLSPLVHADHGRSVAVRLNFGRASDGRVAVALSFQVTLSLVCQRCLDAVEYPLDETVNWVIAESGSAIATEPDECELLVLGSDKLRPVDLLEDELIVSLPLVPRHGTIDECGPLAQNLKHVLRNQDSELASRSSKFS
jgi:uncharacterized protein